MKRNALNLILTLVAVLTPAAYGMHYTSVPLRFPPFNFPGNLLTPSVNNTSACTSISNTIAVGYEVYNGGFRVLCADAGRIGFWTTPVPGPLVGQDLTLISRYLCPSSSALAGLRFVEGLLPFPLCGTLVPDMSTGAVQRSDTLFGVDETVQTGSGAQPCPQEQFIQSLVASRNAQGAVVGFGQACNDIVTAKANLEDVSVDLAVRTVRQKSVLGRNGSEQFSVDVFNLGVAGVFASNVMIDFRFDAFAWDVIQPTNVSCLTISAHKGPVDIITVGKRCTIPGSAINGRGGKVTMNFNLVPIGPEALRPATSTAEAIFSVKANVIDESLQGADPNDSNNLAAFPVLLQ